jgi:hypothetical protein
LPAKGLALPAFEVPLQLHEQHLQGVEREHQQEEFVSEKDSQADGNDS